METNPDSERLREEIMVLLRAQILALEAPASLTDRQLIECYERQTRVQELREKLHSMERMADAAPRAA